MWRSPFLIFNKVQVDCKKLYFFFLWHWCCGHPKQAHGPAGLSVKETDWRGTCCFTNWVHTGEAIRKDFEGVMRIQMAPDVINGHSPPFISSHLYFAFFLISSPPLLISEFTHSLMLLWKRFSCSDRLINLEVFIVATAIRVRGNYSLRFRVVCCGFFQSNYLQGVFLSLCCLSLNVHRFFFLHFSNIHESTVSTNC